MNEEEMKQAGSRRGRFLDVAIGVVIGVVTSLVAGIITWEWIQKERVEITCRLEGWRAIVAEADELEGLEVTYAGQSVSNVLKVSWRIANSGNRGIESFETPPSITYPDDITVVQAIVSEKPELLTIDKEGTIDSEKRVIKLKNIGSLNENESFKLDVYMLNAVAADVSPKFFEPWRFVAKALDLVTKMELERAEIRGSTRYVQLPYLLLLGTFILPFAVILYLMPRLIARKFDSNLRRYKQELAERLNAEREATSVCIQTELCRWEKAAASDDQDALKDSLKVLNDVLSEYSVVAQWDAESGILSFLKGEHPTHERYTQGTPSSEIAYGPDGVSLVRISMKPSISGSGMMHDIMKWVREMLFGK